MSADARLVAELAAECERLREHGWAAGHRAICWLLAGMLWATGAVALMWTVMMWR